MNKAGTNTNIHESNPPSELCKNSYNDNAVVTVDCHCEICLASMKCDTLNVNLKSELLRACTEIYCALNRN